MKTIHISKPGTRGMWKWRGRGACGVVLLKPYFVYELYKCRVM